VHVVNLIYAFNFGDSLSDFIDVKVRWCGLQDQDHTLPEGQSRGPEDYYSEDIGADRVTVPQIWPDVNDCCGNDDAH